MNINSLTSDISFFREKLLFISCLFSKTGWKLFVYSAFLISGILATFALLLISSPNANAGTRVKDIVSVQGVRDNILVGYGLVVGLNGTGDKLNNSIFTEKSLQSFLEKVGVNTGDEDLKVKNVAAVSLTATLPPFARNGSRIDISVSAIGDAKSLQGGTLIATPLMAADGNVYAVAQGAIAIGGFEASGDSGGSVSKGVPTNGFISNGAIIEREIVFELDEMENINLALRNPDFTTATNISAAINKKLGVGTAKIADSGTVVLTVPESYKNSVAILLSDIEGLEVETDQIARIIIDEASGTIVMNENVSIDTVAVAQGNLVVTIKEEQQVSQPGAFAPEGAETANVTATDISVEEGNGGGDRLAVIKKNANLRELVDGLNSLGVGPRDLINILQTIKVAGALQAKIEAR